jgi:hypothetical protein
MSDSEVKNQDLGDDEVPQTPRPKPKKSMNLSAEERQKRSDRMKKLREKLDNIGKKPENKKIVEKKKNVTTSVKEKKIVEEPEENNDYTDNSEGFSEDSEVEEQKPLTKTKKPAKNIGNSKRKAKPTPRKVFKIKYYEEPSQAELLQDRLFLENQHRADNEAKYVKKQNNSGEKNKDDLSEKLFNY